MPILLINIGSGISVLKFEEKNENFIFERIGGTSLGGGFLIGL